MNTLRDLFSKTVIQKMKSHFAVHGIPCKLLTDNGPQFVSREFESFTNEWGSNTLLAVRTSLNPKASWRIQLNKPRSCWRNARKMDPTPCLVSVLDRYHL